MLPCHIDPDYFEFFLSGRQPVNSMGRLNGGSQLSLFNSIGDFCPFLMRVIDLLVLSQAMQSD